MSIRLFGSSQILTKDETLNVTREGSNIPENTVYVDGKPVKRNAIEFTVVVNVQPMNGRDLLLVPEGDRFKEQYWLFLNNNTYITDQGLEVQAVESLMVNDFVMRLGVTFQVQSAENWGSYVRARIMRVDTGPRKTP